MRTLCILSAVAALAACGGEHPPPQTYSAPVGISLPIASGDVSGNAMSAEKNVNTEVGNPYGAFVNGARAVFGHDPSHIALVAATLQLQPTSAGVTALEQVFTGPVTVSFALSSGTTVTVATLASPAGAGPVPFTVSFDSATLSPADVAAIDQGQFKVVLAGTPAGGFAAANARADLVVTLVFMGYA